MTQYIDLRVNNEIKRVRLIKGTLRSFFTESECECERKRRVKFHMRECYHTFCGRCLNLKTVILDTSSQEHKEFFFCPICKATEKDPMYCIAKQDFYDFLLEKNICTRCFQEKTLDIMECKHGICFKCIGDLLVDETIETYKCHVNSCNSTYDLTSLHLMWTTTMSKMSDILFSKPCRKCDSCLTVPILRIKKCSHSVCWNCITNNESKMIDNRRLQRCPVGFCKSTFPAECFEYHIQQLKSTMHMALFYVRPTERWCVRCKSEPNQVCVKFTCCWQVVCQTCLISILEDTMSSETPTLSLFGSDVDALECFRKDCRNKIPIVCLKAMELALTGNTLSVAMFLRLPSINNSRKCILCDREEVYIEIAYCRHQLCRPCVEKKIVESKDEATISCIDYLCEKTPVLCLKAVIETPIEEILKNNVDYYDELKKRLEDQRKSKQQEKTCDAFAFGSSADSESTFKTETKHQQSSCQTSNPHIEPWYGSKITCGSCRKMAVLKSEPCSHGWCVACLKSKINEKNDDLQCSAGECSSTTKKQYAKRVLRKCKTEGSLIPAYIKVVLGTLCDCKRGNQAIIEEINCGHQLCIDCLCESTEKKESAIPQSAENGNSERMIYSFQCPKDRCSCTIDEETSKVLYNHLQGKQEVAMFIDHLSEKSITCDVCEKDPGKATENDVVVRIKRCGHSICHLCYKNLLSEQKTSILECPTELCQELFIPISIPRTKFTTIKNCGKEDCKKPEGTSMQSASTDLLDSIANVKVEKTNAEESRFTFQDLEVVKGREEHGLPNVSLSCYRNAVYQILAETPNFFSALASSTNNADKDWTFILCEILWQIMSKRSFRRNIEKWLYLMETEFSKIDNSFVEYRQNDCLSFLTSLINGITDEIKKRNAAMKDPADCFRGQLQDKFTCCKCKMVDLQEPSNFLSLPLPAIENKDPKIGESLYQFLKAEKLEGMFKCKNCDHDIIERETIIKRFPDILVLQLGMISEDHSRVSRSPKFWNNFKGLKNNIHLTKVDKDEFSKYDLYGVIVHSGGLSSGHYYAYVKGLKNENWELRDDDYVRKVDQARVLQCNAYILFYHKCPRDTGVD